MTLRMSQHQPSPPSARCQPALGVSTGEQAPSVARAVGESRICQHCKGCNTQPSTKFIKIRGAKNFYLTSVPSDSDALRLAPRSRLLLVGTLPLWALLLLAAWRPWCFRSTMALRRSPNLLFSLSMGPYLHNCGGSSIKRLERIGRGRQRRSSSRTLLVLPLVGLRQGDGHVLRHPVALEVDTQASHQHW
jgi:hypothetical protein